jgi:alkanesulfonate monooxygenase SsuD/methylene tetrahydromethanopterin reductase-like flavin-dependent oxidoreductase (luciferase family)
MKVGIQLPEVERRVTWTETAEMARLVEDGGLDSIWVGEHLLYETADGPRGPWEAFSMMAALAAVTERVEIGPLVAATSFHNPAMLAKQAATLDEITGGRFVLGLGAGWNRTEFDAFGFPYDNRTSRFIEAFTIIRTLLRDGAIEFRGVYHDLPGCILDPRGPTAGGPPLLIGTTGPRMLAATLPHVQLWNAWYTAYGNDPGQAPALLLQIDEACRAAGREPDSLLTTLAMLWHFETTPVTRDAGHRITDRPAMIDALAALDAAGLATVQLVLDPITPGTIEQVVEIVAAWRSGRD